MDRYLVPPKPSPQNPKPVLRHRWKRSVVELNGRFDSKYRHQISALLMQSYAEIGAFPHLYHIDGTLCQTHMNQIANGAFLDNQLPMRRQGISALEFDAKGIYLASVTKSGCLTVHDFEALYCQSNDLSPCSNESIDASGAHAMLGSRVLLCEGQVMAKQQIQKGLKEDERKHLLHLSAQQQLDVVKWNPVNQNEVACTSLKSNEVLIFDISYISSEPIEVLRKRHTITVHGCDIQKGLSDVAFTSVDDSRLLASDAHGVVSVWDRRISDLPCLELTTNSHSPINSIQFDVENQIVFGAGKLGIIYMWDLRGGRTSAAFQSYKGLCHPPLTSLKIASLLEKIGSLKAQSDIVSKEVHSIALDPSCPYQLAFHLDDGWSGVLDIHNLQVTHIHCPPPAWLNGSNMSTDLSYLRKPSWSPTYSIYTVGSSSDNGIHLLDFYPDLSSPCHVDYSEDIQNTSGGNNQNRFVHLSEGITACATHPLNGTIIAGTKQSSLLVVSQRHHSCQGGDYCPSNEEDH